MTADHLLIDVGNGRTKFGLATRDAILEQRDAPTPAAVPRSPSYRHSAGHFQDRTVDVAGFVRSQERIHVGDFLGTT